MIASNSFTVSPSLSRISCVCELLADSTSSAIIKSAREPVSCPVIPIDLTLGACDANAGATSKLIFECLWLSLGIK